MTIAYTDPITFDTTDLGTFRRIIVSATLSALGVTEVIWDGAAFTSLYSAGSVRSSITNGYHFSLLRSGGWPLGASSSTVTVNVISTDTFGNESAANNAYSLAAASAPTFAGATSATGLTGGVRVSWAAATDARDSSGAIVYAIHASTSAAGPFVEAYRSTAGVTHYDVFGLTSGTPYYFKVRAINTAGVSDANTAEVTASTANDVTAPTVGNWSPT